MTDFINEINDAIDTVTENDSNFEVKRGILGMILCCREMQRQENSRQGSQPLAPSSRRKVIPAW